MNELKITIDQLKNYLETGLNLEMVDYQSDYVGRKADLMVGLHQWDRHSKYWSVLTAGGSKPTPDRTRPIVYRLSDLDKEIEHNGERFVPLDILNKRSTALTLYRMETKNKTCLIFDTAVHGYNVLSSFNKVQQLFEWHFWPFGDEYFEQGLVIDKRKEASNG